MLKRIIKTIKNNIPILSKILNQRNTLLKERDFLKEEIKKLSNKLNFGLYTPGHFYSPIPDLKDITPLNYKNSTIIDLDNKDIDFNKKEQINLIKQFKNFYPPPFPEKKNKKFRYYYINPNFSYGDAISLYSMIRF